MGSTKTTLFDQKNWKLTNNAQKRNSTPDQPQQIVPISESACLSGMGTLCTPLNFHVNALPLFAITFFSSYRPMSILNRFPLLLLLIILISLFVTPSQTRGIGPEGIHYMDLTLIPPEFDWFENELELMAKGMRTQPASQNSMPTYQNIWTSGYMDI